MRIHAVYFSPTGTTKKVTECIAQEIAGAVSAKDISQENTEAVSEDVTFHQIDFTLKEARNKGVSFTEKDFVVVGVPVYAGRVPNVLLPYLRTWEGGRAKAVCVVLYGNRNYDDALIELSDLMQECGFDVIAATAFVGEHSFSKVLAAGRPDEADMETARGFATQICEKLKAGRNSENGENRGIAADIRRDSDSSSGTNHEKFTPAGERPYRKYYMPRDKNGNPVDIRKVTPKTNLDCVRCKLCAKVCPMGSIDREDMSLLNGICIKCGACIKKCPKGAKYYDDPGYLNHQYELEEGLKDRKEPELFL